jgi:hypothetical protein
MGSGFFGRGDRGGAKSGGPADAISILAQVRGYWEGLRIGSEIPSRAEIDPRGIEGALLNAFILERVGKGIARFRIAGTELTEILGLDPRGMPFSACFTPEGRTLLAPALEQVFQGPARLEMELSGEEGFGRPKLAAQVLLLPLRTHHGDVGYALGCLVVQGQIGRLPRRFTTTARKLVPLGPIPLEKADFLRATLDHAPQARPLQAGFAEGSTPFRPARAAPGRAHLKLVK